MTTRRAFLATIPAVALAACTQSGTTTQTPAQVIADLQVIASALANDMVVLGILPAAARATIQTAVTAIGAVAQKVAQGIQDGASGVQAVYADVQAILDASAPYVATLPKQWVDGIAAAETLLPVLALLVGVSLPAPVPAAAALPKSTPAAARAALAQHAGKE